MVNLGQPYDPCKKDAFPTATCLQECKKKATEVKCSCSDTVDTFPDNITMTTCDVLGTLCNLKLYGTVGGRFQCIVTNMATVTFV